MIDITQSDIDAGKALWDSISDDYNGWANLSVLDRNDIAQAFARHRIEEREEIVALLSGDLQWERANVYQADILRGLIDRIQSGEHLK
jgi:hypothetical protein